VVAALAIVLLGVVGLVMLAKLLVAANPAALAKGLRWAAIALAVLLEAFLTLRGQFLLAGILVPAIYRFANGGWRPTWFAGGAAAGPSPGQSSSIHTAFLDLTLDHDSGALTGMVLRGRWQGRGIETLSQAELIALWRETVAEDAPSAQLVETYLDRQFPDWRDLAEPGGRPESRTGAMTRDEALRILELHGEPSPADIVEAHRRLMMANHPDRGGSAYLAALINQAKEVLTGPR
jgi:hypothetical protein